MEMPEPQASLSYGMPVLLPAIGQGVQEAILHDFPKKIGEWIRRGEELAVVESDKATHSIESPVEGTISKYYASCGARIPVGVPICEILTTTRTLDPLSFHPFSNPSYPSYRLRHATTDDFPALYDIWHNSQSVASVEGNAVNRNECYPLLHTLLTTVSDPFAVFVACFHESIAGWVGLFPCKSNPISRNWVAEMSLYVAEPDATVNPAMLLQNHAIRFATKAGLRILFGYTNRNNHRAAKMLSAGGFRILGVAGRDKTTVWCYDC